MKAAVLGEKGVEVRDLPKPEPKPNEVLIRVRASSLNRADLLVALGHQHGSVGGVGARIGLECSGEVEAVGSEVKGIKAGDRVMGSAPGGFAEYAVTDAGRVHRIPGNNMTYEQAACFPVALQTMHNAVVTAGRLKRGETLLIQGASAGVGLMGMQIGKLMGASLVIGTSTNPAAPGAAQGIRLRPRARFERSELAGGGQESDRRQGRRPDRRSHFRRRRQPEPRSGGDPRPHRQCRAARRHEGRVRLRQACAQAHRLYRRHLPHPHASTRCARSTA